MRDCRKRHRFVPTYNGNREADAADQFAVVCHGLSPNTAIELQQLRADAVAAEVDGRAERMVEAQRALVDAVRSRIAEVEGFGVTRGGELVEVKDPAEFVDAIDQDLFNEVMFFMASPVDEEDLANLGEPTSGT